MNEARTPKLVHSPAVRPAAAGPATVTQMPRKTFRETQFELRAEAILDATNRLLAEHGYDVTSMDDIAAEVGVAKGSLYKHFDSKETLAASVMLRLITQTEAQLQALLATHGAQQPLAVLKDLLAWTLRQRLAGGVPHLPSTSPALQQALLNHRGYVDALTRLSEELGALIVRAREAGLIGAGFRDEFVLYTIYARSCDPTLDFLKLSGSVSDDEIVEQMVAACFDGLQPRARSAGR